jgi:hypothetical protein
MVNIPMAKHKVDEIHILRQSEAIAISLRLLQVQLLV